MPFESAREDIAKKEALEPAHANLNSVDLLSQHDKSLNGISKEPAMLALGGVTATTAGALAKLSLDNYIYRDYGVPAEFGNPLLSKNLASKAPEWIHQGKMPWLEKQFEASSATAMAREASVKYIHTNFALTEMNRAAKASVDASTRMPQVMGRSGTEMILGPGTAAESTASMKAALLKLDPAKLDALKLRPIEYGIVHEARNAAIYDDLCKFSCRRAYDGRLVLDQPAMAAAGRTLKTAAFDGAIAVGANLAVDAGAKALADYFYGPGSEAGKIMETNALGLGLSTFGYVAGSDLKTKLAYAGAGWMAGKVFNYLAMPTETLVRIQQTSAFNPNQRVSDLISSYGDRQLGR